MHWESNHKIAVVPHADDLVCPYSDNTKQVRAMMKWIFLKAEY